MGLGGGGVLVVNWSSGRTARIDLGAEKMCGGAASLLPVEQNPPVRSACFFINPSLFEWGASLPGEAAGWDRHSV